MKPRSLLLVAAVLLAGCELPELTPRIPPAPAMPAHAQTPPTPASPEPIGADAMFDSFAREFLDSYLELNPVRATELGDHRFDGRWPALGEEGEKKQRELIKRTRAALDAIPSKDLDAQHRVDAAILRNQLDLWTFTLDELRPYETDPMWFTGLIGDGLDPLVTRDFAPIKERMTSLGARLGGVPTVVAAAKSSLKRPPKLHTETAIEQVDGLIALVTKELDQEFDKVPELKEPLRHRAKAAAKSLEELREFLKKELLARSDGNERIGRDRFEKKLRYALLSDVPSEELYRSAREVLDRTRKEMVETSLALWPELFPKQKPPAANDDAQRAALVRKVLDAVAKDRPTNATILAEASKLTDEATEFVRKHGIVELPKDPIRVIEMPEYRRGISVAYCDSSGPFEKNRLTFFAISPTPTSWSAKRTESFYREYNRAMLAELTVHEAMPGHYLQIAHAARFRSPVRAAFESGAFIEGWAVYAEWVMARHGFGGLRTKLQREKMVLRMAANALIDHDVHAGSMTEKDAMRLMTTEAFQEEGEAAGKWRRARLTSAQLSTYLYGFTEMMKMRERAEKTPGFDERTWHDRLLSFGSPAPRLARHVLFGDPL